MEYPLNVKNANAKRTSESKTQNMRQRRIFVIVAAIEYSHVNDRSRHDNQNLTLRRMLFIYTKFAVVGITVNSVFIFVTTKKKISFNYSQHYYRIAISFVVRSFRSHRKPHRKPIMKSVWKKCLSRFEHIQQRMALNREDRHN